MEEESRQAEPSGMESIEGTTSLDSVLSGDSTTRTSLFHYVQDGFQLKSCYEHSKKLTELVDVTYNPRTKQFIFLDTRGITTWYKDGIGNTVNRSMTFPKYQNKLLRNIVYARKYNVYFCLAKDFSLKVLNKDFEETCNIDSDLSSVMFLLFNPVRDELITGGVKGTKVWKFRQVADEVWREIKPMANYKLFLMKELETVKGSWIKKVELNEEFQHMYCCSDTEVHCYDMDGKSLFKIERAHTAQINGCKYSPQARLLVTCSNDTEVKVWSLNGGLINVFRGHSKPVSDVILHPETSMLVLTASLDGSIKIWSLDIMELLYSMVACTNGIRWMGVTTEGHLWTATAYSLSLWLINEVVQFYGLARCGTTALHIAHAEHKTSRVLAVGDDSSVRLVSMKDQKNLSTVLPPPSISPLKQVLSVAYNRDTSLVYLLVEPTQIWVYTMKTDPACRTAVWDVIKLEERGKPRAQSAMTHTVSPHPLLHSAPKVDGSQRASSAHSRGLRMRVASAEGPAGVEPGSLCQSLLSIHCHIHYWLDQGFVCPRSSSLLLLGLQDGRILFMDPVKFGEKICELQACKDAILAMQHDIAHSCLVVKSHMRDEDLFQFWSLPELQLKHEVLVPTDLTGSARLADLFYTGHSDGSILMHKLVAMASDPHAGLRHTGLSRPCHTDQAGWPSRDHSAPIVAMDACPEQAVFVTCSSDAVIKVWDAHKTLLNEISLSQPLSAAKFLNARGDLIFGYLNHLFMISHTKVLPSAQQSPIQCDELFDTESEIYEDPAVRYEGAAANPDPLDLENYLVPFNLDLTQRFLAGEDSLCASDDSSHHDDSEGSESEASQAPSEVYRSPAVTPRSLSMVDMLLPKDHLQLHLAPFADKNKDMQHVKWRQSSRRHSFHSGRSRTGADFEFPKFGRSPGPSPSPTPPSTPSEASISEVSSETEPDEEVEEEEEEKVGADLLFTPLTKQAGLEEKKPASKVREPEPAVKEEEPRYGLSTMKIDSRALLSIKRQSLSSTTKNSSVAQVSEEYIKKRPVTEKAPVKKKEKKANRVRVGQKLDGGGAKMDPSEAASPSSPATDMQRKTSASGGLSGGSSGALQDSGQALPTGRLTTLQLGVAQPKAVPHTAPSKAKRPIVKKEKRQKQPIFNASQKVARDGFSREENKSNEISAKNDTQDVNVEKIGSDKRKEEAEKEAEKEEEKGKEGVEENQGVGGMAMFKAASKLQISQKYGPQQARIVVGPRNADTGDELSHDAPRKLDVDDDSQGEEGRPSLEPSHEESKKAADTPVDDHDEASHRSEITGGGGKRFAASERCRSAQERHVSFAVNQKRVKSAAPKLMSGGHKRIVPHADNADTASIISSLARTEYEAELADIPGSSQSVFDDTNIDQSPTPPNISVSVLSKTSTHRTSLLESHIGSGLSQFETNSPFFDGPSARSTYSPVSSPAFLLGRMMNGGGRVVGSLDMESLADDDASGMTDLTPVNLHRAIPFSAPPEGRRARPNTAQRLREDQQRPHTAGADLNETFKNEDYGRMREEDFQRQLDLASTPPDLCGYLKNDGLHLDKNWPDRMIHRHTFLKMQKEQRARSAADRRQLLELRQRQRRKALLGHNQCSGQKPCHQQISPMSQTEGSTYSRQAQRAKSAPAAPFRKQTSSRTAATHSPPAQRSQAVMSPIMDRRLAQTPSGRESPCPAGQGSALSQQHEGQHTVNHQQPAGHKRSSPVNYAAQSRTKSELSAEKPYRFRFSTSTAKPSKGETYSDDIVCRDSSTKHLIVKKKQSAKSIPSKPRRYVLVQQPGTELDIPTPSTLEEQLLAKRFPKMHKQWQIVAPQGEDDNDGAPPQRRNSLNPAFVNVMEDSPHY